MKISKSERKSRKKYYRKLRARVLMILGGAKCARCGFKDRRALQIDHKVSVGHNRMRPVSFYYAIANGEVPPESLQVLCSNCNWIKRAELGETK